MTSSNPNANGPVVLASENDFPFDRVDSLRVGSAHAAIKRLSELSDVEALLKRIQQEVNGYFDPVAAQQPIATSDRGFAGSEPSGNQERKSVKSPQRKPKPEPRSVATVTPRRPERSTSGRATLSRDPMAATAKSAVGVAGDFPRDEVRAGEPEREQQRSVEIVDLPETLSEDFGPAALIGLSATERLHLGNLYLCLLARGVNPDGQRCYAYFSLFASDVARLFAVASRGQPLNPKDFGAIVLARSTSDPDPAIEDFMRYKFSFQDDSIVLEYSAV